MAVKFYNSTAAGAGTGADWTNAYTTLAAAAAGLAAGDTLWVGDNSAESTATITATFPGTAANPNFIYCVDHLQASPGTGDLKTTATVTSSTSTALTLNGIFYCYGVIFTAGSGANAANLLLTNTAGNVQIFDACALRLGGATGGNIFNANGTFGALILNNTTIQVAAAGSGIQARGKIIWKNTASAITGATLSTTLFVNNTGGAIINLEAVDLSALSSKTIFANFSSDISKAVLKDCKLPATVTISAAQTGPYGTMEVELIRCDSSGTNYRQERHASVGDLTTETTIVRTGGATDGTQVIAHKIVTNANSKWIMPFECIPITFWNTSTSAITTLTIYGTSSAGGLPNDDDIWIDVEYPGDASSGQGSFKTSTKANNLAASSAVNNSTDASTWGGAGAGNGFKIVCPSFTPAQAGPITIYVRAAKASVSAYYIDPLPSISGVTISKSFILAPGVYANELSSGTSGGMIMTRVRTGM